MPKRILGPRKSIATSLAGAAISFFALLWLEMTGARMLPRWCQDVLLVPIVIAATYFAYRMYFTLRWRVASKKSLCLSCRYNLTGLMRFLKLASVALCVVGMLAWGASLWRGAYFAGSGLVIQLNSGIIWIRAYGALPLGSVKAAPLGFHFTKCHLRKLRFDMSPHFERMAPPGLQSTIAIRMHDSSGRSLGFFCLKWSMYIPLAMALPFLSILWTCLALLSCRCSTPGHCPCGYDLTGNVSGRCPECGHPLSRTPP